MIFFVVSRTALYFPCFLYFCVIPLLYVVGLVSSPTSWLRQPRLQDNEVNTIVFLHHEEHEENYLVLPACGTGYLLPVFLYL